MAAVISPDLRCKARNVYIDMSSAAQAQHTAAWQRVHDLVESCLPKDAKVFEAHHAIEHARKLYLFEMAKGLPADLCERAVFRAYGKES